MLFSIYVLREDPDYAIFDRALVPPPIGEEDEYDRAGFFAVEDQGASFSWTNDGSCHLGVIDEWMLNAQSVLCGDFTDKRSGNTAKIRKLYLTDELP